MENAAAAAVVSDDMISRLPDSIIETILTKLPIRDAVTTCILSTQWRYKWTSLTHLVLDDYCMSINSENYNNYDQQLVNFITSLLFHHNGPIHHFSLSTTIFSSTPIIDHWLLQLSQKDIKSLLLDFVDYQSLRMPLPSVFSCNKLTRLELNNCKLQLPSNFEGFSCLKHLSLNDVQLHNDDIEFLVSSSPLLEKLTLSDLVDLELTINAPNLTYLSLHAVLTNLRLGYSPLLVYICITILPGDDDHLHVQFEQTSGFNFDKFHGAAPNLERLIGRWSFIKYLSIGYHERDYLNPITYHHLKSIELIQVSFNDLAEVRVVLQLIARSPNLQDLLMSIRSVTSAAIGDLDMDYWERICALPKLKTVKMMNVFGKPIEVIFIKYLLKCSPGLETMTIQINSIRYKTERVRNMLVDLESFPRTSPHASIKFHK